MLICVYEQGFTKDLRPLYKQPMIDLMTYLDLLEIMKEDKLEGR